MNARADEVAPPLRYGAMPDDWSAAATYLPDVLPTICHPTPRRNPSSNVVAFSKVPSYYTQDGAVGFVGWTAYNTSKVDLAEWESEPDYGICLATRRVRALDLDIDDAETVARVVTGLIERTGVVAWPIRWRADSARVLLPFIMPADAERGDLAKRVVKIRGGGAVEILGTGQQFVAAGTHSGGARLQWSRGYPCDGLDDPTLPRFDDLPELSREKFEELAAWMAETFGADGSAGSQQQPPATRTAVRAELARDPIAAALHKAGLVRGSRSDGGINVNCPWREEHSGDSGPSEATYWPPHTGGYSGGAYRCLHAHCEQRTLRELRTLLGVSGSDVTLSAAATVSTDGEVYAATEDGIALAFAASFDGRLKWDNTAGAWYVWTGDRWRQDDTLRAFDWARQLVRGYAADTSIKALTKTAAARAVEAAARSDQRLIVDHSAWDADRFKLCVPGGYVDLLTGDLHQPDTRLMMSRQTTVAPAARGAACPVWGTFLNDATQGDGALVRFLKQLAGYILTGGNRPVSAVLTLFTPRAAAPAVLPRPPRAATPRRG